MEHSYTEYWIQSSIIIENSYWKMVKIWNGLFSQFEMGIPKNNRWVKLV